MCCSATPRWATRSSRWRNCASWETATASLPPGTYATPFGALLLKSSAVPADTVIALDKNCALEMVTAGGVGVEYDKVIDCQTERVGITCITGFAKLYPDAVKVLKIKE